jgi:hypothetical protein
MDPPTKPSHEDAGKHEEELSTLQYWLVNEDVYTSSYVLKWLKRTPSQEAADTLACIAQQAYPESHSLAWMFFHGLTAMLTTAEIVSKNSPAGRKAGIRAALLLAGRNDPRALAPLARVFEPHWFWESKYQPAIEAALLSFLSKAEPGLNLSSYRDALLGVAERLWHNGAGRKELSARRADLLIALLQQLSTGGEERERRLLKTISAGEARSLQRGRVQETAAALADTSA